MTITAALVGNIPALPVPGITPTIDAVVSKTWALPGSSITIKLPDVGEAEAFSIRLVPATDDPWSANAVQEHGPFIGVDRATFTIDDAREPGTYKLLISTSDRRTGTLDLTIGDLEVEAERRAEAVAQRPDAIAAAWAAVIAALAAAIVVDLTRAARGRRERG